MIQQYILHARVLVNNQQCDKIYGGGGGVEFDIDRVLFLLSQTPPNDV